MENLDAAGVERLENYFDKIGKVLGVLAPPRWKPVEGSSVARALVEAARRDLPGIRVLENPELRAARG